MADGPVGGLEVEQAVEPRQKTAWATPRVILSDFADTEGSGGNSSDGGSGTHGS